MAHWIPVFTKVQSKSSSTRLRRSATLDCVRAGIECVCISCEAVFNSFLSREIVSRAIFRTGSTVAISAPNAEDIRSEAMVSLKTCIVPFDVAEVLARFTIHGENLGLAGDRASVPGRIV